MDKIKIYPPTLEGTEEMIEELAPRKIPVREEFDETAAENLAEETARDEDWGLKTETDPIGEDVEDNEKNQKSDE